MRKIKTIESSYIVGNLINSTVPLIVLLWNILLRILMMIPSFFFVVWLNWWRAVVVILVAESNDLKGWVELNSLLVIIAIFVRIVTSIQVLLLIHVQMSIVRVYIRLFDSCVGACWKVWTTVRNETRLLKIEMSNFAFTKEAITWRPVWIEEIGKINSLSTLVSSLLLRIFSTGGAITERPTISSWSRSCERIVSASIPIALNTVWGFMKTFVKYCFYF